ncbi:Mitochondrial presequence protease, partial [Linderina macrospora]
MRSVILSAAARSIRPLSRGTAVCQRMLPALCSKTAQQLPLCRRAFSVSAQPREKAEVIKPKAVSASALVKDQELHGFVVENVQSVSELKLKAIRLRHKRTGAEWLHIDRDDSNNVFSIGFNTSPND